MHILQNINSHEDLLQLSDADKKLLCKEIREFLVSSISRTGGHLAANLGIVELAVAIETVFDTNIDRLVFDVGHQSYVHKILTGRRADFAHLRQYGGISGFPKPDESITDAFTAGHASSSVSVALGMARARSLMKEDYHVVTILGDGAATGGMAFEGLNDAAVSREPMIIILNDNEMSISKNVGGVSRHLSKVRSSRNYLGAKRWYRKTIKKLPLGNAVYELSSNLKNRLKRFLLRSTIFECMGLTYLGPVDGHDLAGLISVLTTAKELHEPVLIHVVTRKGYGYSFAEEDPAKFHGIGPFDPVTGKTNAKKTKTFSDSFGECMMELAEKNDRVCAITAAMPAGTGLLPFMEKYPDRCFDVGIAEEHAVSMAGGLAKQGMIPVVALYSTFLQRSYDQLLQDIALQRLHVVFAIDRAGLVGDDGPTHHGVFDIGFLRQIPDMLVLQPASLLEQQNMIRWAVEEYDGPVAVRYPRGGETDSLPSAWSGSDHTCVCHRNGKDIAIVTYGTLLHTAMSAAQILSGEGLEATVLRLMDLTNLLDEESIRFLEDKKHVIVVEEVCSGSGIREALAWKLHQRGVHCRVSGLDLGKRFVPHGSQKALYEYCGLDDVSIAAYIREALLHEK